MENRENLELSRIAVARASATFLRHFEIIDDDVFTTIIGGLNAHISNMQGKYTALCAKVTAGSIDIGTMMFDYRLNGKNAINAEEEILP